MQRSGEDDVATGALPPMQVSGSYDDEYGYGGVVLFFDSVATHRRMFKRSSSRAYRTWSNKQNSYGSKMFM